MPNKQKLVDAVLDQIKKDIVSGDATAIEALIENIDHDQLVQFLPEDQWINHPRD